MKVRVLLVGLWASLSCYLTLSALTTDQVVARAAELSRAGRYGEARGILESSKPFPPAAEHYRLLGTILRLNGLFQQNPALLQEGLDNHETAARLNPLDADLYQDVAWGALQVGDLAKAERAATTSLELDPSNAYGLYILGRIQERQGLVREAAATYRRALAARSDPVIAARLRSLDLSP